MIGARAILLPLLGGALIGLSVSLLLLFNGRIAGVSGILGRALDRSREAWRWSFLAGLLIGGLLMRALGSARGIDFFGDGSDVGLAMTVIAGLLVGFGTQLGSGCTSGHGVCGISRFSLRSLVATLVFIAAGVLTVAALRWVIA